MLTEDEEHNIRFVIPMPGRVGSVIYLFGHGRKWLGSRWNSFASSFRKSYFSIRFRVRGGGIFATVTNFRRISLILLKTSKYFAETC
jgi:hypothetical protein